MGTPGSEVEGNGNTRQRRTKALREVLKEHGQTIKTITFDTGDGVPHGYAEVEKEFPVEDPTGSASPYTTFAGEGQQRELPTG